MIMAYKTTSSSKKDFSKDIKKFTTLNKST